MRRWRPTRSEWPRALMALLLAPAAATAQETSALDRSRFALQESFNSFAAPGGGGQGATRSYAFETEISYAPTDWYQISVAVPVSFAGGAGLMGDAAGAFAWNGITLRQNFITPHYDQQPVFFGLGVQFAYTPPGAGSPALADTGTRLAAGLTPIVGFHVSGFELMLSPSFAFGLGSGARTSLAPAARLTRKLSDSLTVGIEYSGVLGAVTALSPPSGQVHVVYSVVDVRLGGFDLNIGVGHGLSQASGAIAVKGGIRHEL